MPCPVPNYTRPGCAANVTALTGWLWAMSVAMVICFADQQLRLVAEAVALCLRRRKAKEKERRGKRKETRGQKRLKRTSSKALLLLLLLTGK